MPLLSSSFTFLRWAMAAFLAASVNTFLSASDSLFHTLGDSSSSAGE
ncbi:Uncharacterised protein [Mycobacterium tuberculosis]|nr:Uncharacterised protein [Mycobacterium tuberculosis]